MTTERDLGPQLNARLTYLLKHALIALKALHAEHLAPVGVSGRELAVLLLLEHWFVGGESLARLRESGRRRPRPLSTCTPTPPCRCWRIWSATGSPTSPVCRGAC